jgi:hypothetical protein
LIEEWLTWNKPQLLKRNNVISSDIHFYPWSHHHSQNDEYIHQPTILTSTLSNSCLLILLGTTHQSPGKHGPSFYFMDQFIFYNFMQIEHILCAFFVGITGVWTQSFTLLGSHSTIWATLPALGTIFYLGFFAQHNYFEVFLHVLHQQFVPFFFSSK